MKFCDKLKELRQMLNITQEKLSRDAGISIETYRRWERGLNEPKYSDILRLSSAMGIKPTSFFTDDVEVSDRKDEKHQRDQTDAVSGTSEITFERSGTKITIPADELGYRFVLEHLNGLSREEEKQSALNSAV